jgi:uncharacterized protein
MTKEIRSCSPMELREDEGSIKVEGYAAVFNEETNIGGVFREKIAPGAFADAVNRDDVVFLINHEGLPLARTRSGTLTLREDEKGLLMSTELDPNDPDVKAIVPKMQRGDLDKMSFAFFIDGEDGQDWDESDDIPVRTIKRAALADVSIVTNPAYDGTSIGLRAFQEYKEQHGSCTSQRNAIMRACMKDRDPKSASGSRARSATLPALATSKNRK